MAADAIVFAMANPVPEVQPEEVGQDVAVMATGRSDYPNQINNVLAFPGVFQGALDVRASTINEEMKLAAGARDRRRHPARTSCTPTTSSRACSTAGWPRRSPRPSPPRRWPAASPGASTAGAPEPTTPLEVLG